MKINASLLLYMILAAVLLTSQLLIGITTSVSTRVWGEYDPWCDLDDDGDIDIFDIVNIAGRYGTTGTPINKTELLELQARVDALNATVAFLIGQMEKTQNDVSGLNSSIASLLSRIAALEAFEVNSTYSYYSDWTTETASWVDMDYTSLSISLRRTSHVLILFSSEAEITDGHGSIRVRAVINGAVANPSSVYLTPVITEELGYPSNHRHNLEYGSYSYNFYAPSLSAGNYTVKIQWRLLSEVAGTEAVVRDRTVTVLAFPIE